MKALTILSLASVAAAIFLSTPVADARTWTSADGSKTFSGELRTYDPGTGAVGVTLANGKKMTFKQDKLSEEDRAYLKKNGAKTSGSSARIKKPSQNMAPVDVTKFKRPVKLACVGDSITQGVGAKRGQSWPDQLRAMLGDQWEVKNFGLSGTTLMNNGDKPYQKCGKFNSAVGDHPDVVVIMLGTNDTKPNNWKHFEADYEKDYRDLVADFAKLKSKPRIFVCYPPYIGKGGHWGINERDTKAQIPVITRVAQDLELSIIDVHGALDGKDQLIPDKVHPNTEGASLIAKAVFKSLTIGHVATKQ